MVRIHRVGDSEPIQRSGYEARYFADVTFKKPVQDCGFIIVDLKPGSMSAPHGHAHLEEVFMALSSIRIHVDDSTYNLDEGDMIVVEPGEIHSFEVTSETGARLLAMKFPNIKDDKYVPSNGT